MKLPILLVVLALAGCIDASAKPYDPFESPRLVFLAAPILKHTETEISIVTLNAGKVPTLYGFRKIFKQFGKQIGPVQWTDSGSCPQARSVLETLAKFEMPKPHVSGLGSVPINEIVVTADGVDYELTTDVSYDEVDDGVERSEGSIHMSSNVDTPLADWIENSLKKLEPCWTLKRPEMKS